MKQGWCSFFAHRKLRQLPQELASPAAELDTLMASHSLADGQYHIQVVEVYQLLCLAAAFGLNYPEFPDCCLCTET